MKYANYLYLLTVIISFGKVLYVKNDIGSMLKKNDSL